MRAAADAQVMDAEAPLSEVLANEELVFIPLEEEPDGIAGLNPTSLLLMEQLEDASQQRAALIKEETTEAAAAPAATAAFNQTSAGDYSALARQWRRNVNNDIRAWIRVPGTNINYAVCYHPDVNYYTHRGYYKENSTERGFVRC
jgi:hypothetical protein